MVEANNNHESPQLTAEAGDHLQLEMLQTGHFLALFVAAVLSVIFLFGGSVYLIARWYGWWR